MVSICTLQAMMVKMKGHSEMKHGETSGAGEVQEDLPRLLMMSGSGSAVMQVGNTPQANYMPPNYML